MDMPKSEYLIFDFRISHFCLRHTIGNYLTARIKYTYNSEQSEINDISGCYLLSPWDRVENLSARIYIKRNNNRQRILILFRNKDIFKV
jgi:hypothetical protein